MKDAMTLSHSQARDFYNHYGRRLDLQAFVEDQARLEMVEQGDFEHAESVFEFGCGTGRLAQQLLLEHLSASATYFGVDVSRTMLELTSRRLALFDSRVRVEAADGTIGFPLPDQAVDRVVSTYVLDLLSEADIHQLFSEAQRVLKPGGRLCLISLTGGSTLPSKLFCRAWKLLFRLHAALVGGCRPIRLETYVDPQCWNVLYHHDVVQWGVPSEVLVLEARSNAG